MEERAQGWWKEQRWALLPLGALGLRGIALELLSLQHCHVLLQFQGMCLRRDLWDHTQSCILRLIRSVQSNAGIPCSPSTASCPNTELNHPCLE